MWRRKKKPNSLSDLFDKHIQYPNSNIEDNANIENVNNKAANIIRQESNLRSNQIVVKPAINTRHHTLDMFPVESKHSSKTSYDILSNKETTPTEHVTENKELSFHPKSILKHKNTTSNTASIKTETFSVVEDLDKYKKKCEILKVICMKHYIYFSRANNIINIFIIILNFVLLFNLSLNFISDDMKMINISCNICIIIQIFMQKIMKYEACSAIMQKHSNLFEKVERIIDNYKYSQITLKNQLELVVSLHDCIYESINSDFKISIIEEIKIQYKSWDFQYYPLCFYTIKSRKSNRWSF
jgi:hypothetical protein